MRVAMITPFPRNLEQPRGGVEAVAASLVPALVRERPDLDLHVLRCPADADTSPRLLGDPPYEVRSVWGRRSAAGMVPGLGPSGRLRRVLEALRPDVVHVQNRARSIDPRPWRSVLTVHGIQERDTFFRARRFRRVRAAFVKWQEAPARGLYPHVIAIAGYVAQQLERHVRGRLHFIPNPIDAGFFDVAAMDDGPRILFAGASVPRKNLHGAIEAVGLLVREGIDCTLRVAGPPASGAYAARIEALVATWNLSERVTLLGNLDRTVVVEELARARCLLLPSFQETAPMAVAEAQAAGLPVVAAPAGGTAEMVSDGHSGYLVDPWSPASIADGLRPLLEDASLAKTMGARGRERAKVHRPEVVARKTLRVYEQVARM